MKEQILKKMIFTADFKECRRVENKLNLVSAYLDEDTFFYTVRGNVTSSVYVISDCDTEYSILHKISLAIIISNKQITP